MYLTFLTRYEDIVKISDKNNSMWAWLIIYYPGNYFANVTHKDNYDLISPSSWKKNFPPLRCSSSEMSIFNLDVFNRIFFLTVDGPSLNHLWPGIGAMGSPWLSMPPEIEMSIGELPWSINAVVHFLKISEQCWKTNFQRYKMSNEH